MSKRTGFTHENPEPITNRWITPKWLLDALNAPNYFDIDPCADITQPWKCARVSWTIRDNGLSKQWYGRVWCNPPYKKSLITPFIERMAKHDNGILLVFNRMDNSYWHDIIFPSNPLIFVFRGRISFFHPDGNPSENTTGAGSCLVAWGECRERIFTLNELGILKGAILQPTDSVLLAELDEWKYNQMESE